MRSGTGTWSGTGDRGGGAAAGAGRRHGSGDEITHRFGGRSRDGGGAHLTGSVWGRHDRNFKTISLRDFFPDDDTAQLLPPSLGAAHLISAGGSLTAARDKHRGDGDA